MVPMLIAMPGNEDLADRLAHLLGWEIGRLALRRFPDGESYLRFDTAIAGRDLVFACTLDRPDDKAMALYFACRTARELGAHRIGLVAPYLAYMRQDARFNEGEVITSVHFAEFISGFVDWLVTVDPHLHRHHDLSEIYTVPTQVVHAAPDVARWIAEHVQRPVIIGPDEESEQWVAEVARGAQCPYTVLRKTRRGDRDVEVRFPDAAQWYRHTPVLVDDIASTARTMVAAVSQLHAAGAAPPVCIVVHPLFVGDAFAELKAAGVSEIYSCNTVAHASNSIDLCRTIAAALHHFANHSGSNAVNKADPGR
ncbi:ribose-phosphate pyrophosphokinase [Herbaspirillum sp. HC18]|nr:ribose-phosphate pyrophosphokinase [Herbaspirillum sp. HC18]